MTPVVSSGLQKTVEDRIAIYKTAVLNAKEAGEKAKVRRYERGLKVCWTIDGSATFFPVEELFKEARSATECAEKRAACRC